MKICVLIPNYNHGRAIQQVLANLQAHELSCLIVDDGSDAITKNQLKLAEAKYAWISVLYLPHNCGKGGAVKAGIKYLVNTDFTHILQIDADGQHDLTDIPKFIKAMEKNPAAVIAGCPIYDKSAPKSRVHGRKITNFWVTIETWSREIKDAMCGYRIYPLQKTNEIIHEDKCGNGMEFDIEILVHLHWEGLAFIFIPTHIDYPSDGISHFKMWADNLKVSMGHTRLFFGMLKRLPKIITKKAFKNNKHWSETKERGSMVWLRFLLKTYKLMGPHVIGWLLFPAIVYFYWTNHKARASSKLYLNKIEKMNVAATKRKLSSFKHFLTFSQSALDKLSVWNDDINMDQIDFENKALFLEKIEKGEGGVIFTAHLGNIEVARSLSRQIPKLKINVLVFRENAQKFNSILEKINSEFNLNIIQVESINIHTAMILQEKVNAGEFIVIAADRTSTSQSSRTIQVNFLNDAANFSQGPFMLASILECPVYFMLCLKESKKHYRVIFEEFAQKITVDRKQRQQSLKVYAERYAKRLTMFCQQYPLQWFNFFNFWSKTEVETKAS